MGPKPGQPKKYSNEETQVRNCGALRCKSVKCHNDPYTYKECLKLHDKLHHSQQGKEKVQKPKERNYRVIFRKIEHRCWNRRGEYNCVNSFTVTNEDTSRNQVELVDKNGKIHNSIFIFEKDAPIEKNC